MSVKHPAPSPQPLEQDGQRRLGDPLPQSADAIDRVVRLAPRWLVLSLAGCALLVGATVVWAFAGTVTQSISGPGIYDDAGYRLVRASQVGTVARVVVAPGQTVASGSPVVVFADGSAAVSPITGVVVSVFVSDGVAVGPDKDLVGITDDALPDTVEVLLPPAMTGRLSVGLAAQVEVASAPASEYGYLRGTVAQFSSAPIGVDQIADKLNMDRETVAGALGDQPGILVQIRLEPDPSVPSRQAWTVGQGPPFVVAEGTGATGIIILSEERPISSVFPGLAFARDGSGR